MFDPLDTAFRVGQEVYKAGVLAFVNARRQTLGRPPLGWPEVAATPADVMWSEGGARLLRYRRGANAKKTPLLVVCSLINRPYVLDLLPERSVVGRLLDSGRDVWLLDWGTPRPEDARKSLGEYALGRLPRAAAAVRKATGAPSVHVLGYCMVGTLALAAVARGELRCAGLVALATPVDFHDRGLLSTWCRAPGFDGAALAKSYGNVPPHLLQPAFKMLDPVGLSTKLAHLDEKIGDDDFVRFFLAMETWLEDSVAFPGRAFRDWTAIYRENRLILDGEEVDLRKVRCPLLTLVAEGDYITPPPSSLALRERAGSTDHEVIRLTGGHIGLATGKKAHETMWPAVADWLRAREAKRARRR